MPTRDFRVTLDEHEFELVAAWVERYREKVGPASQKQVLLAYAGSEVLP